MEKTSKVATVSQPTEKTGWYNFTINFDNGDKGVYGVKSPTQSKFIVGQEITYLLEETQYGNKVKPASNGTSSFKPGGFKAPANNSSFALSYAKDVVIGSWIESSPKKLTSEDLFKIADSMYNWMEGKK